VPEENLNLWAPWRVGFILGPKAPGCFLCECPAADKDEENLILGRGETCFAILNRYPYTNGHVLIAPYRHTGDLTELSDAELTEIMIMTRGWVNASKRAMNPHGFNVGFNLGEAGGAGVADHVHLHIVPRWRGDTNFMSTLGDARVVNQSLAESCRLLRSHAP